MKLIGQPGMIEQPTRYGRHPSDGPFTIRTWRGEKNSVPALTAQLTSAGYEWDVQEDGAVATVSARVAAHEGETEQPTDSWEAIVNSSQKDIFEHQAFVSMDADEKELLEVYRETGSLDSALTSAAAADLYQLLRHKVDAWDLEQTVIRFTRIVSSRYVRNISQANVGKIVSATQMVDNEGAPAEIIEEIPVPSGMDQLKLVYGYMKRKPTISQLAGGKWQIVIEFVQGHWTTILYPQATY